MRLPLSNPEKPLRLVTLIILLLVGCWGAAMVLLPIKPFWIDEWRLLYNLKFRDAAALWGPLDFTQQFPRVFLQLLKVFTSALHYSYFSLRLPSFLISLCTMSLCWRLMNRLYPAGAGNRFLFVLILVSSQTFTDYIVQIKQYEMEILLSLVAIWQLISLLAVPSKDKINKGRYALLCASFLIAPFFSYTYPIAVAPVFAVVFLQGISIRKQENRSRILLLQWFPLALGVAAILAFYRIDVSQLMADRDMHRYWEYRMIGGQFSIVSLGEKIWNLFAKVGAGLIFEIIFGILGLAAFGYNVLQGCKAYRERRWERGEWIRLYCAALLLLVILLFLAGKLPVGEPKFNAFTVPSIAILIIFLLDSLRILPAWRKVAVGISALLYLALCGNILSTIINTFTAPEYGRRMEVYRATNRAIDTAQAQGLPILVTPGVAYSDDITHSTPFLVTMTADCILKTFPAYPSQKGVPVYSIPDLSRTGDSLSALPAHVRTVLAGDGLHYTMVHRTP